MFEQPLVVVDLETTGANPATDRITEIGIIEVHAGVVVSEWSSLVDPQAHIPRFIETMTGITNAMVEDAPTFRQLSADLHTRLAGRIFVAHNARFDYGFLKREFERVNIDFDEQVLCTVKLSRRLWPQHRSHGLDAIMARFGINCPDRHRALGDARALWAFLRHAAAVVAPQALRAAADHVLRRPSAPVLPLPIAAEDIPRTPGAYRFFGAAGTLLHIGHADDLRAGVTSQFSGVAPTGRHARTAQRVQHVDWRCTAGPLGAMLAALRWRAEQPLAHERARAKDEPAWSLAWEDDATPGRDRLAVIDARGLVPSRIAGLHGIFPSRQIAERALDGLAAEHRLCLQRIGMEHGSGACRAYALGRCRGVCVGAESPAAHRMRWVAALAAMRLAPWPYRGAVGIREHDSESGRTELHVVDHWCFLGTASSDEECRALLERRDAPSFEPQTYRLLAGYLARRRAAIEVIELPDRDAGGQ